MQCVPKDFNGKTGNKVPLPRIWWGKPEEELIRITDIPDIRFCHASGFMASVGSVESAVMLCRKAQAEWLRRQKQAAADKAALQQSNGDTLNSTESDVTP